MKFSGLLAVALLATVASAHAGPSYVYKKLRNINTAVDINDHGDTFGYYYDSEDDRTLANYIVSSSNKLWRLKLGSTVVGGSIEVRALNNNRLGVGTDHKEFGSEEAALFAPDKTLLLGTLGGGTSRAFDINDAGQIVGEARAADGHSHAFVYFSGTMTDLGTFGATHSSATAINVSGDIVGDYGDRAFLYNSGGQFTDIGTLGGATHASAISDTGFITGSSAAGKGDHAFLYSWPGRMSDLGTLGGHSSYGASVNSHGQVVGVSYLKKSDKLYWADEHAFVTHNGKMVDLNTLVKIPFKGFRFKPLNKFDELTNAVAINNRGQIVVESYGAVFSDGGDYYHSASIYLLTPIPTLHVVGSKRTTNRTGLFVHGTAHYSTTEVRYRVGSKGVFRKASGTESWIFYTRVPRGASRITIMAVGPGVRSEYKTVFVKRT